MAGKTTPSGGSTRFLETSRGVLSYAQLAPLLAEKVLGLEHSIASGEFDGKALDSELILLFHAAIAGELVPEWAGGWRKHRKGDISIEAPFLDLPLLFASPVFTIFPHLP